MIKSHPRLLDTVQPSTQIAGFQKRGQKKKQTISYWHPPIRKANDGSAGEGSK